MKFTTMGGLYKCSSKVNLDDGVRGEEPHDEIHAEDDVVGESIAPIVEKRIIDSSCAEMSDVADVSEPSVIPTISDTTGKTVEHSLMLEKSADVAADDAPERDNVDVTHVDDMD
ncbi:hypothetical protein LIER_22208 [Lithospermum erythrorhizon]|uniref:Uncharacterized protein n=1 Tax=Lithospermum erythrorhizon TaxID=34254 RepID=A0AAV3QT71_LITER